MYNFNRGQYQFDPPTARRRLASKSGCGGCTSRQWPVIPQAYPFIKRCSRILSCSGCSADGYQRDRRTFWYFGTLMFTMTLMLIYYLNFKLGASQDLTSQANEVRDRDYLS